jgi:hypothetical protein
MGPTPGFVFACGIGAAYIAARLGLFGVSTIKIKRDDSDEHNWIGLVWNTAYWKDADCDCTLYHTSVRPIRFEHVNEYSIFYFPKQDALGNKN